MADYTTVTELPGTPVTREQIARAYHRYFFASSFGAGKDVLEAACGAGLGLGMMAQTARRVTGGDIDEKILAFPLRHYHGRENIEIKTLDAQKLPFPDSSFDVVLLYEAIYYLPDYRDFFREAHRVLRKNGVLLIATVNRDWADFNPSPFSTRYLSVPELSSGLKSFFPQVEIFGAFPVAANSFRDHLVSFIKRTAVALHLMPKTMKGKEFLKRIFFGQLEPLPPEITREGGKYLPPSALPPDRPDHQHKVIYSVGKKA